MCIRDRQYAFVVINIVDEAVECLAALDESCGNFRPVALVNDARNNVEGPGAIDVGGLGVDGERNAELADGEFCRCAPFTDLRGGEFLELGD